LLGPRLIHAIYGNFPELMLPPFPQPPQPLSRTPRVSVVITNHSYAEFLPRALRSSLEQSGPDVEVIVGDDG
jgi:hypothetical protein